MNKDTAKDYLPLVQALAEGKTIQVINSDGSWTDLINFVMMEDASKYRIKPEPKKQWCRMYLVKGVIGNTGECFYSAIALNGHIRELEDVEKSPIFVRWLTDRIEYTLPEGDA